MKLKTSVASRPARRAWRPAVLLAWSAIVVIGAGCGQKGPLTMPGASAAAASAPVSK